jgi:hypothetical protein
MTTELPTVMLSATPRRIALLRTSGVGYIRDVMFVRRTCDKLTDTCQMEIFPNSNLNSPDILRIKLHLDDGSVTEICGVDTGILMQIIAE